jgi:putative protease
MGKLGDTVYHLRNLTAQCDGTHMLPASALNQMRRTCLQQLDAIRIAANTPTYACHAWDDAAFLVAMPTWRTDTPMRRIRVRTKEQLHALTQHRQPEEIRIVPLSLALDTPCSDTRDLIQPPRWTQSEQQLVLQLQQLRQMGWQHLLCENPAHIRIGTSLGFVLHGGMDLHTVNGLSAAVYQRDGLVDLLLSPELTRKQIAALHTTLPVGVYAYGKLPVMLMRSCPIRQEVGCKSCTGHLIDRTKRQFPVLCHEKNSTELCNAVPVWMADRLEELSCADFLLLDMTDESPSEMLRILQAYRTGTTEKPAHITRGLLYRGISHTASS